MKKIQQRTLWTKFKPQINHLDKHASMGGHMFETFGKELDFVKTQNIDHVWTITESDNKMYICSGFHYVNRIGYIVTQFPCKDDVTTGAIDLWFEL